jgi:DNA polymerase III delta prime subunit
MADASQGQSVGDIDAQTGGVQIAQAQRDVINAQNSQIIKNSYYSLFGGSSVAPGIDWERAMQILKQEMQPEIKKRLKDSLFGLADVDVVEVKPVRQEYFPELALEAVKMLTIDGAQIETIDSQMPIIQTYAREDIKGKLLILGTPGAGKTITLLKLAEQLVCEAIAQPKTAIPIIFELSTWRDNKQSIRDWLVEQLYENHSLNPNADRKSRHFEEWLDKGVLLPLLDGLDELGIVRQKACTEKVNEFAKHYPWVVVCCRVKEFQQAGVNLSSLRGKVQLQPLTDNQIQDYLKSVGKSGLWQHLHTVPEMRHLLQPLDDLENSEYDEPGLLRVPLFIKLAAESYTSANRFSNKSELLESYIEYQLSRDFRESERERRELVNRAWAYKTIDDEPDTFKTRRYIKWLARKVVSAEMVDFQLAWAQYGITNDDNLPRNTCHPIKISWLENNKQRSGYRFLYIALMFLLAIVVSAAHPYFVIDLCWVLMFSFMLLPLLGLGYLIGLNADILSKICFKKGVDEILIAITNFLLIRPIAWCLDKSPNLNHPVAIVIFVIMISLYSSFLLTALAIGVAMMISPFRQIILSSANTALKFITYVVELNPLFAIVLVGSLYVYLLGGIFFGIFGRTKSNKDQDREFDAVNFELARQDFFFKDKTIFLLFCIANLYI